MSLKLKRPLFEPRHDKTNKMSVHPAKTQISLADAHSLPIRPVWSASSLWTQWVAKDPWFLHADSEDSDQTGRTPRRIWVFAEHTLILLVLSCRGSFLGETRTPWQNKCHVPTCSVRSVVSETAEINWHNWWRAEKSKIASKMVAQLENCIHSKCTSLT